MSAIFAYYFPQFYETKENSKWWGQGFTDWKLVKEAQPLYGGHNQPRVPQSGYYDQSDLNTLRQQVGLANQFSITGFNFYHYWFNGQPYLSKPIEMLLENTDLNIRYMLTWANESWTRQWIGKPNDYLIKQTYYKFDTDVETHYRYISMFFKDKRYYKLNNRPLLSIYRPELIPNLNVVLKRFNELAIDDGFSGLYLLACRSYDISGATELYKPFHGIINFNPRYIINTYLKSQRPNILEPLLRRLPESMQSLIVSMRYKKSKLNIFSYEKFLDGLENSTEVSYSKPVYHSVFPDWDNTARYKHRATLFSEVSIDGFRKALTISQNKLTKNHEDLLFINAWNEWSEGAYLEPDYSNGMSLLNVASEFTKA